ncbi:MAG: LysM peptidoglycan-binding domain-containing protein [Marinilabiliales bacterium]|nr:MAG: LysM peptidoglycan-binding domain-containing protein [Marinilabiliales bacterium]
MKRLLYILFSALAVLSLISFNARGAEADTIPVRTAVHENDTLPEGIITTAEATIPEITDPVELDFESNLDSLLNLWYVSNAPRRARTGPLADSSGFVIPSFPDSVYIERLARLPSVIDLSFNNVVRNYINVYTVNRREQMEVMLALTEYYFPLFEQILDYYDIPLELRYLPVVESALNPRAVSRVGATGIWQFMFGTARMYNLTMNSLVDERRDPYASTHAAARYLKDLFGIYNDWTLALAAYNCGPGNVNRAIRRAGGSRDYWRIYYFLPRETRGYVPAFIAATYAMNYYTEHALSPADLELPLFTDTVMINRNLHLMQVAEVLDIPVSMIRDMNPQYRRDVIPADERPFPLRLPAGETTRFAGLADSVYAYRADHYLKRENLVVTPGRPGVMPDPPAGRSQVNYTVKSGDNLGYISQWFNVRVSDLRHWNGITGNLIRTGQRLVIYVPSDQTGYYNQVNNLSFAEKQARVGRAPSANRADVIVVSDDSGEFLYYTVRRGDTLWGIARQFPGVSERDILRLNSLSNANRIYPGQQLRIKPSG